MFYSDPPDPPEIQGTPYLGKIGDRPRFFFTVISHVKTCPSYLFDLTEIIDKSGTLNYSFNIMETIILSVFVCVLLISRDKNLLIENLALRQQLAIMKQHVKRPKIRNRDRIFWVIFSRLWKDWKSVLIVVKPETVIHWHRKGFKLFWTFKSRKRRAGRPSIAPKIRKLIQDMARANPLWRKNGDRRIMPCKIIHNLLLSFNMLQKTSACTTRQE